MDKTYHIPVPLYCLLVSVELNRALLLRGPNVLFLPLFTSPEYATDFCKRLGSSHDLGELSSAAEVKQFVGSQLSSNLTFQILIDPIAPALEEFEAFPVEQFLGGVTDIPKPKKGP